MNIGIVGWAYGWTQYEYRTTCFLQPHTTKNRATQRCISYSIYVCGVGKQCAGSNPRLPNWNNKTVHDRFSFVCSIISYTHKYRMWCMWYADAVRQALVDIRGNRFLWHGVAAGSLSLVHLCIFVWLTVVCQAIARLFAGRPRHHA